uniref:DNA-directed DNA polymerase n=1 Tax=Brugia timori TaxID=42155 RepID=A0A0R3QH64_9BILA
LRSLVDLLTDSDFAHTKKVFGRNEEQFRAAKQKGFFPYDFIKSFDDLKLTRLPEKNHFYNKLTDESISDENYNFAQHVWRIFNCKSMSDYMRIYCEIDTTTLADVFCAFRKTCLQEYNLDPTLYITLPGYAFDVMKKHTNLNIDLFDESEATFYNFFESAIRGGITNTNVRYCKANTNCVPDTYDASKEPRCISYIDKNSLYSFAMMQFLPSHNFFDVDKSDFGFFTPEYISSIEDDAEIGYFFCIDVEYSPSLHDTHNDLPFFPEKKSIPVNDQNEC